jgi:hypothetical protein
MLPNLAAVTSGEILGFRFAAPRKFWKSRETT